MNKADRSFLATLQDINKAQVLLERLAHTWPDDETDPCGAVSHKSRETELLAVQSGAAYFSGVSDSVIYFKEEDEDFNSFADVSGDI